MRTALITGASGGIGQAIALEFAERGYNLVLHCHKNKEKCEELGDRIKGIGDRGEGLEARKPVIVAGDLSDADEVTRVIGEAGHVDVLINNAGITRDGLLMTMKEEDFDKVIEADLKSVYLMSKAVIRPMIKQRYGRIINLTSVSGIYGNAGQSNYAAAKAGIIGFSKSLAKEVASRNITVNCIAPGAIDTEMTQVLSDKARDVLLSQIPMKRMGRPEEIAYIAAALVDERASYITGAVVEVSGGM
ncbi:MAG: 3-oxoacyl-[Lachnospiraceae bacterium]|nr:3-oxoacyl-[acyl-carrier-protein] reductase [Lachnospiraceae bacterium]